MATSDAELVERLPSVAINHDNKHHFRGWLQRRLLIMRCASCGRFHHPPGPVCPGCWSAQLEPTQVSGHGHVHLLVGLHQGPPADNVDYAAGPYPVVAVELDEQPALRFTSTVVGCPPGEVHIGQRVQLDWIERGGAPFPVFRPELTA